MSSSQARDLGRYALEEGSRARVARPQRWSAKRKVEVVLRLLKPKSLDAVSRETGVTTGGSSSWREILLERGKEGLKSRRGGDERGALEREKKQLQAKVGELTMDLGSRGEDSPDGQRRPFSFPEVEAMSQTPSASTGKRYGVRRVCALWRIPRSSYYAWSKRQKDTATETPVPAKPGPKTALSDEEIVETIREIITRREADDGIRGEGYRKIRAQLADRGYRVGRNRVLRLMR